MQLLLIKPSSLEDTNPHFALLGKKQKEDRFSPADWKRIRSLVRGRKVVLLLPDDEITLNTINIPSKNKKQLAQAIPYALEESLAEDIEDLHFAIHSPKPTSSTKTPSVDSTNENNEDETAIVTTVEVNTNVVAIINHQRLSNYLDMMSRNHIPVNFVLPQLFSLEFHPDAWSLLVQPANNAANTKPQQAQMRLNEFSGFACDQSMLDIFLPKQLEQTTPSAIYSNLNDDELPKSLSDITHHASADFGVVKQNSIMSALPLNLLTGFVRKRKASKINFKPWKPAFALAGLLGAIWLGIFGWQNVALENQLEQLDGAINKVYKNTFPTGRIVDPTQQMASKLKQLQTGKTESVETPLPLIANIAPLLKTHKDMTLHEIRYKDNELRLVVRASNLSSLENFKSEASTKANLNVTIKSSTTTANKVEATLVITNEKQASNTLSTPQSETQS